MTQAGDTKTLAVRIKEFFGLDTSTALKEYRTLDEKDKADYVRLFNEGGMPTVLSATEKK